MVFPEIQKRNVDCLSYALHMNVLDKSRHGISIPLYYFRWTQLLNSICNLFFINGSHKIIKALNRITPFHGNDTTEKEEETMKKLL
jgi:hypothetical protein